MTGRIVLGVLLFIVLIVAIGGVGTYAYNVGLAQGVAQADKLPAPATGPVPYYPYYGGPFFFHPFGFGFGFLGLLFPLFFFFLIFALVRGIFWGGRWGHRRWMAEGNVPAPFEEWHRKAHEKQ